MLHIQNTVINFLINSIPEELFLFLFCYALLDKFGVVEFKDRIKKAHIYVSVVLVAGISNVLRVLMVNIDIISLVSICAIFIFILASELMLQKQKVNHIKNTSFFLAVVLISVVCLQTCELYIPAVLASIGKTLEDLRKSASFSFLIALPERLVEYSILTAIIIKKTDYIKVNVLKTISKSKKLTLAFTVISATLFTYLCVISRLFYFDKILLNMSFGVQLFFIAFFLSVPIIVYAALGFIIYSLERKEIIYKEELNLFVNAVQCDIIDAVHTKDKTNEIIEEISRKIRGDQQ